MDVDSIQKELEQVFRERGPPKQVLLNNSMTFRSTAICVLFEKWAVSPLFRCAYKPSGNGIVERNHRTIKRMAARSNSNLLNMVFLVQRNPT